MASLLPSLSALPRAFACRASCVLPRVEHVSEYAEGGNVMHAFLERVNALRQPGDHGEAMSAEDARAQAASEAPEEERYFLEQIPVEDLPTDPKAFAAEVALAFDVATGEARELGRNIGRRYEEAALAQGKPLAATEIVGSVDVAALWGADGVAVQDWKRRGRYVKRARDNWQIRGGLVLAARAWGRSRGLGGVIRIFDDGREPFRDRHEFSAADLDQAQVELTQLAVRIFGDRKAHAKGESLPAVTGEHCRYCPSFQFCPANLSLARRAATESEALKDEILISRDTAPKLVAAVAQLKAVTKAVEDALDALASQEAAAGRPLELSPGTWYAPIPRAREVIDGAKAKAVLEAELGAFAAAAIEIDVTKAGLKRAITKKLAGARGVSKVEEEILMKLRVAGAVKRTVSYSCDVTTKVAVLPKPAAQEAA